MVIFIFVLTNKLDGKESTYILTSEHEAILGQSDNQDSNIDTVCVCMVTMFTQLLEKNRSILINIFLPAIFFNDNSTK